LKTDLLQKNSQEVKSIAQSLGFEFCGIAKAEKLVEEESRLESWLNQKHHASMQYMENHFELRLDPTLLVPGAKTVISLMYNYFQQARPKSEKGYKIAQYAWGKDYHKVVKKKLQEFIMQLNQSIGQVNGRVFVDSAPILERSWAARSGLGWVGKNSMLINKKKGSFYFLAEIISDLEAWPDIPDTDHCGTCTACIDACPTDAILPEKNINSNNCISYFTIEHKDKIGPHMSGKMDDWIFGCDICQDVCPWNRFAQKHQEPKFEGPKNNLSKTDWEEMTHEVFNEIFAGSPLKRAKWEGIKRNILFNKKA
tara:strand:- start:1028 stop:1957 length:930 start_codon:yes stop_codon:yes gene_type:complete